MYKQILLNHHINKRKGNMFNMVKQFLLNAEKFSSPIQDLLFFILKQVRRIHDRTTKVHI